MLSEQRGLMDAPSQTFNSYIGEKVYEGKV